MFFSPIDEMEDFLKEFHRNYKPMAILSSRNRNINSYIFDMITISDEWARPIFNLTSLSKEEREERDYNQLGSKRRRLR